MSSFLDSLFGKKPSPKLGAKPSPPAPPPSPSAKPTTAYQKGDVIGDEWEVQRTLGEGGFGVVYLVSNRQAHHVCALKTFRDELLVDDESRDAFQKEALLWVHLEEHPFIVVAQFVQKFSGRLFVAMEYVAPDAEGRVNLYDHLRCGKSLTAECSIKWGIQFCRGMEHANTHGVKCHRDVKPANILISQGVLKISDFGLAAAAEVAWKGAAVQGCSFVAGSPLDGSSFSIVQKEGRMRCGTPGYMPPEVYRFEPADVRSDIYSFGLVLWQMAAGSVSPPFAGSNRRDIESYSRETYEQQMTGRVPPVAGPLGAVVERCLSPEPSKRYSSFEGVRGALEPIYQKLTGRNITVINVQATGEQTVVFWSNKGASLSALGRHGEAIGCYDKVLVIDPRHAIAWGNKGYSLGALKRHEEAIGCYDKALAIDPRHAFALGRKGQTLAVLGRYEEAIGCYDKALAIDPRDADVLRNKGHSLNVLGRYEEAISCFDKALVINPRDTLAWYTRGDALAKLRRYEEATADFDKALAVDPQFAMAWGSKGETFALVGRHEEAISCYNKALAIDPCDATVWRNKANLLNGLGRYKEAISCFQKALASDPLDAAAWHNLGYALATLTRHEEAIKCYARALGINPREATVLGNRGYSLSVLGRHEEAIGCYDKLLAIDPRNATGWLMKGISEDDLGNPAAAQSYGKFLELAPPQNNEQISHARKRIQALTNR